MANAGRWQTRVEFDQVQREAAQRGVVLAHPASALKKGDIKAPVQVGFNMPMLANCPGEIPHAALRGGYELASVHTGLAVSRMALRLDHADLPAIGPRPGFDFIQQVMGQPVAPLFDAAVILLNSPDAAVGHQVFDAFAFGCAEQAGEHVEQLLLVALDGEHLVTTAVMDGSRDFPLVSHCVNTHQTPLERQRIKHGRDRIDLNTFSRASRPSAWHRH